MPITTGTTIYKSSSVGNMGFGSRGSDGERTATEKLADGTKQDRPKPQAGNLAGNATVGSKNVVEQRVSRAGSYAGPKGATALNDAAWTAGGGLSWDPVEVAKATKANGGKIPISVRNNNPGNLTDADWERSLPGYVGSETVKFKNGSKLTYSSWARPDYGLMAQGELLGRYYDRGLRTIDSVINRYAPPGKDNSPEAVANYKNFLSNEIGVGINDPLTREQLVKAGPRFAAFETGADALTAGPGVNYTAPTQVANAQPVPRSKPGTTWIPKQEQATGIAAALPKDQSRILPEDTTMPSWWAPYTNMDAPTTFGDLVDAGLSKDQSRLAVDTSMVRPEGPLAMNTQPYSYQTQAARPAGPLPNNEQPFGYAQNFVRPEGPLASNAQPRSYVQNFARPEGRLSTNVQPKRYQTSMVRPEGPLASNKDQSRLPQEKDQSRLAQEKDQSRLPQEMAGDPYPPGPGGIFRPNTDPGPGEGKLLGRARANRIANKIPAFKLMKQFAGILDKAMTELGFTPGDASSLPPHERNRPDVQETLSMAGGYGLPWWMLTPDEQRKLMNNQYATAPSRQVVAPDAYETELQKLQQELQSYGVRV